MNKIKLKIIVTFLIISTILLFFSNSIFAKYSSKALSNIANWKVSITNDTKDLTLENIQEIEFEIEENENVTRGKIAPGTKAIAKVELDLTGTNVPVDFTATIDKTNLVSESFSLISKLDNEIYTCGTTKIIQLENNSAFNSENGKRFLIFELEWNSNNDEIDTAIGIEHNTIKIPIKMTLSQHIDK